MVDFGRRRSRGGGLQPSRSLPMSTLNQRERTAPSAGRRSVRGAPTDSPPSTPNPYAQMTRRTPGRALSAAKAETAILRASSPSKYEASSPQECWIPTKRSRSFGIWKALVRAASLLLMGFGCGMIYDLWNTTTVADVESIPSVLLNDELVKKLAQDNQLQEHEIQALKQQVEEEKDRASKKKPELVVIGKYGDDGQFLEYKQPRKVGGLRAGATAGKRFTWDDKGENIQEVALDGGESAAVFDKTSDDSKEHPEPKNVPTNDHDELNRDNYQEELELHRQQQQQQQSSEFERDESQSAEEEHNVDRQQREEYYHQDGQHEQEHPIEEEHIWAEEHERIREGPTEEQQRDYYDHPQKHKDSNWDQNSVMEELCINHPLAEVKRICEPAHNVVDCLKEGCKGPEAAKRYMQEHENHHDNNNNGEEEQPNDLGRDQQQQDRQQLEQQQVQQNLEAQQQHDQNWDQQPQEAVA